ncbi:MAG: hypothetical protein IH932_02190 [Thaumarchaeota archaeon]|nr:hypothetical protein [Nitrososphaerota archaeon]
MSELRVPKEFGVHRQVKVVAIPLKKVFDGIDKLPIVHKIFGKETVEVLNQLIVELHSRRGYMGVSQDDGRIFVSQPYLREGPDHYLYLDIIHELVHVKQQRDGKDLFDEGFDYVDRPTEIEAYKLAAEEARRIGMNDKEIMEYLQVEWLSSSDLKKLVKNISLELQTEFPKSKPVFRGWYQTK